MFGARQAWRRAAEFCHENLYSEGDRAFDALDTGGQAALRNDLERLWTGHNQATDNTTRVEGEYLEVIAVRD